MDDAFYKDQLLGLMAACELQGNVLRNNAAIIAEHGGTAEQLREIIKDYGRMGEAMLAAINRGRKLMADHDGTD